MPTRLPPDLLHRSAQESSRLLALNYLDAIDRAQTRLSDPQDSEALHDFRVGLRRLRSCVRAYRGQLKGSATGKMLEQLRQLTQATNTGRDTEVQLTWLQKQGERLGDEDTQGFFWFTGRLEGRKVESLDPATAGVAQRYSKASVRWRRRLGILRIEVGNAPARKSPTFGEVSGDLIGRQVARLREDLTRVRGVNDVDEAHRARIAVKRLRYLIEPVARGNRRARALIPRLKEAQDLVGEHHDMHVMSAAIASARAGLPGSDAGATAKLEHGLATLEHLAAEQAGAAFERFYSLLGGELANRIFFRAAEIGKSLRDGPKPPATVDQALDTRKGVPNGSSAQSNVS